MSNCQLNLIPSEFLWASRSRFLPLGVDSEPEEVEFCDPRAEFIPLGIDFGLWGWSIFKSKHWV